MSMPPVSSQPTIGLAKLSKAAVVRILNMIMKRELSSDDAR